MRRRGTLLYRWSPNCIWMGGYPSPSDHECHFGTQRFTRAVQRRLEPERMSEQASMSDRLTDHRNGKPSTR